jgi:hypothetical protein
VKAFDYSVRGLVVDSCKHYLEKLPQMFPKKFSRASTRLDRGVFQRVCEVAKEIAGKR